MRSCNVGCGGVLGSLLALALVALATGCDDTGGGGAGRQLQFGGPLTTLELAFQTSVTPRRVVLDGQARYAVSEVQTVEVSGTDDGAVVGGLVLTGPTPGAPLSDGTARTPVALRPGQSALQAPVSPDEAKSDMSGPMAEHGVVLFDGTLRWSRASLFWPRWPVTSRTRVVVATQSGHGGQPGDEPRNALVQDGVGWEVTLAAQSRPDGTVVLMLLEAPAGILLSVHLDAETVARPLQPGEFLLAPPAGSGREIEAGRVSARTDLHPLVHELHRLGVAAQMTFDDADWRMEGVQPPSQPEPSEPTSPSGS